ncbi:hypothetical protein C8Q80DRAFT_1187553 [Daedaleopsis nitida]|nr:hypothetical protein C8Q80DRAFT_1187553 [Daedaleopsis nitida]
MAIITDNADPTDSPLGDNVELAFGTGNETKSYLYIPPEVTDHIIHAVDISSIWGGRRTILNCALVCRNWLPAARLCLFTSYVELNTPRRYDLFKVHVLCSASMKPWLEYMQSLHVENDGTAGWRMQQFILDIAGRLPNLQILHISRFDWVTPPPHPSTYRTFSSIHAIQELKLYKVKFPTFGALRCMLTSLPQLSVLALQRSEWPPTPTQHMFASGLCHKQLAIVHLTVDDRYYCSAELFRWLAITETKHSIQALILSCDGRAWPESWIDFITVTAHLVTELYTPNLTTEFLLLPISKMVGLRALDLSIYTRDPWSDLASALQRLPGTHLQELSLTNVRVAYQSTDTANDTVSDHPSLRICNDDGLKQLEHVLLEDRFRELQVFDFYSFRDDDDKRAYGEEDYHIVARELNRKMPKLSSSGVLRVGGKPTTEYRSVLATISA